MPAENKARVKEFYETVFSLKMTRLGEDMGNYLLATTSPWTRIICIKRKELSTVAFMSKEKMAQSRLLLLLSMIWNRVWRW
jgi:hypothetical protein